EELLEKYAWYTKNSLIRGTSQRAMLPGARGVWLKPNDFGLFNMLGNAAEWCQDRYEEYRPEEEVEDTEDDVDGKMDARVLRGGSFYHGRVYIRSAFRDRIQEADSDDDVGFRPVRTFR